jgi:hypothetical protein
MDYGLCIMYYVLLLLLLLCIIILPQFCDVATLVSIPQEELAKFGYRPERKVENFQNIALFWQQPAETYCLKYDNFGASFFLNNFNSPILWCCSSGDHP